MLAALTGPLAGHISDWRIARSSHSEDHAAPAFRKPPGSPPFLFRRDGEPWLEM